MYFVDVLLSLLRKNANILPLFIANFFVALHVFLLTYINSSFLSEFVRQDLVGTIYILASILSLTGILYINRIIKRFGNYRFFFTLILLEVFVLLFIATANSVEYIVPLFLMHSFLFPLILLSLDIFLEAYSKNEKSTGEVRGVFLTVANVALILAPLSAGFLVTKFGDYHIVYLVAAITLSPIFFLLVTHLRKFKDPKYETPNIIKTLEKLRAQKNIQRIFAAHFFMRFFFTWMVIYMPIYLHEHIGFSWSELGIMFTIMLLPFVLLEYPLGRIADTYLGEKEILATGFIIMALSTALVPFITSANIILWTLLLVSMRIGAASAEIMTESYFFKHVDGDDAHIISFFRALRPISYICGPIVATVALTFISIQNIFLLLGIILFLSLPFSLELDDTK